MAGHFGPPMASIGTKRAPEGQPTADSEAACLRLWFSVREQPWSALVVVPVHSGASALRVAEKLAWAAEADGERPVRVLNAQGLSIRAMRPFIESIGQTTGAGTLAIVVVDSPLGNQAAIPIARAAEKALLVLSLGETLLTEARETLAIIGRERFLGGVLQADSAL
jgi:hypothetical protein